MNGTKKKAEETEDRESIRAYDAAKVSDSVAIPFLQATQEIERSRKQITP